MGFGSSQDDYPSNVDTHLPIPPAIKATPHQLALKLFAEALTARHLPILQPAPGHSPPSQWCQVDGDIRSLNSTPLPFDAMLTSTTEGATVLELFGGMAAGLEMLLRNGVKVIQYYYCDHSPAARQVALHRLQWLTLSYPDQLPTEAWLDALTTFPQDI